MLSHDNKLVNLDKVSYEELLLYITKIKNDPKNNYFTKVEDEFLIANYYDLGLIECAKVLNRPLGSVSGRAKYLGLRSKVGYTKEQKEFLKINYPRYGAKYCAKHLDRTVEAIQKYAEATLKLKGKSRAVPIYCVELNAEYTSAAEASKLLGISSTSICNALRGYSKTAGGYTWKYKEDYENEKRKN